MNLRLPAFAVLPLALSACGGGGSTGASTPQSKSFSSFVAPLQNETRVFAQTDVLVDGDNSTHNVYEQISQVNGDGSYTANWHVDTYYLGGQGPYGNDPWSYTYNSVGDIIGSTTIGAGNCTYSFPSGGRPVPLQPGQSWSYPSTSHCTYGSPTTTTASGTYLGVESVSVPAGIYTAYKFQTQQVGNVATLVVTDWYDASPTDSRLVRELSQYNFNSNYTPNGQAVSYTDMQLASY